MPALANKSKTTTKSTKHLIELLSQSQIYKDYEKAYNEVTGLPLALRPTEIWNMALHKKAAENPFCSLMAQSSKTCSACLETQEKISRAEDQKTHSTFCFAGLCDTAIPVHVGENIIGFLQTGQVALKAPSKEQFNKITRQVIEWGIKVDLKRLEDAYFHSKLLSKKQYQAAIHLLETFSSHLALVANQIAVQQKNQEPPMILKAREYIHSHQTDDLSLSEVAKAVNVSVFYFCKMFKKATGLNFTDYLSRARIEKSKNLLLNPNARVSEIAYETGFRSLTHFNRVFRKIVGKSPTTYRQSLPRHPSS